MPARTWIAIILSIAVWLVFEQFFAPKRPVVPPTGSTTTATTTNADGSQTTSVIQPSGGANPYSKGKTTHDDYWVKSDNLEIAFSDVGGQVSSIRLLKYKETTNKDAPPIQLLTASNSPFAMGTIFSSEELQPFRDAVYQRTANGNHVKYVATLPSGATLTKEYNVEPSTYKMSALYTLSFPKAPGHELGTVVLPVGGKELHYNANEPLKSWEVVAFQNDSIKRHHIDSVKDGEEVSQGVTSWVGYGNRYFASVIRNGETKLNPDAVFIKYFDAAGAGLRYPLLLKEGGKDATLSVNYFLGPKEYDLLSQTPGMKRLIDYGFFSVLAYPLLDLLRFFYRFCHNYGLAIILLTLMVRLLFYPLSVQSSKSMKEMQKLQPRIAELKEKYGDDRERFQREQMALFKTHKVNPFGGCLPILVQIPVFIALYAVLGNSIELFQSPFFGWIHDLSAKDPLYVFPILMGISMVIQQKITPAVGMDPAQQKMMMVMPLVFSFMMLSLPSGLTVYMFISTLLGILQQYIITGRPSVKAPAVAAVPEKG